MGFLFPILLLAMSVYVLFNAIKGEGKLFSMENFKDDSKEQAKKIFRGIYFGLAGIMLVLALTNALSTVLYTNQVTYYRVDQAAYRKAFPDLINENGQLLKTSLNNNVGSFDKDENGNYIEQADANGSTAAYNIANDKMDAAVCINGFIQNAYNIYAGDTTKFPQSTTGSSILSCTGGTSIKYDQYFNYTALLDANGNPIYAASEDENGNPVFTDSETANGHTAYISSISGSRSDANDGSFVTKLYGAFSQTLLSVLNYVFLGLAVLVVIAIFVITRKFTDKEKLQKAREQQVRPAMPSDAFNFDDDEPKQNASKDK